MAPALRGLGYGMLSITVVVNMYYTVIMAWGFQYMFEGEIKFAISLMRSSREG
jgi:SNF family Na+-dependent transporter